MDRFVALYRGINVGGNNLVKMEALRAMHEGLGHRSVASYIQSGNIVFACAGEAGKIGAATAARFLKEFGFASRVMVVSEKQWTALVKDNPYAAAAAKEPKTVHAAICDGKPDAKALKALLEKTGGPEAFVVKGGFVYLHAPEGVGNSKFAAGLEKACGCPITVRNWRTVEALAEALEKCGSAGAA